MFNSNHSTSTTGHYRICQRCFVART